MTYFWLKIRVVLLCSTFWPFFWAIFSCSIQIYTQLTPKIRYTRKKAVQKVVKKGHFFSLFFRFLTRFSWRRSEAKVGDFAQKMRQKYYRMQVVVAGFFRCTSKNASNSSLIKNAKNSCYFVTTRFCSGIATFWTTFWPMFDTIFCTPLSINHRLLTRFEHIKMTKNWSKIDQKLIKKSLIFVKIKTD